MRDDQVRRYARHVLLPEVGGKGQARLLGSSVALSSATGADAVAIVYLAAAGVGTLVVSDRGLVTQEDVTDSVLYEMTDEGRPRLEAVGDRVAALNPDVRVVADGPAAKSCVARVRLAPRQADDPVLCLSYGARAAGQAIRELLGEA